MLKLREQINASNAAGKISVNDFVIKVGQTCLITAVDPPLLVTTQVTKAYPSHLLRQQPSP